MRDRGDRWDYLLAGALGVLTVLSRLPFRARMLYNWDGVQFALALREYDVVKHQPHPPGYILYVGLGRVVNAWLHDPTAAYVLLAVAFSGLTTCVVYLLARAVYDRATALAAASVLAVSPLFWFYGSVGLTYAGGRPTTSVAGPFETTLRMSRYLLESGLVALGPLALAVLLVPWYVRRHGWGRREWLLLAWIAPPVLVYTLVHFGQAGYVLTFLPALVVLLARVLVTAFAEAAALARRRALGPALTAAAVVLVVLVNGAFFVNARPLPRDFDTPRPAWRLTAEHEAFDWIFSRTAAALREHEEVVRTFVEAIRGLYPPEEAVVITELGNTRSYPWMRHAMFYLPEYSIFELRVGELPPGYYAPQLASDMLPWPDSDIRLPARTRRLVWFVDHWAPSVARPAGLVEIELPYGRFLYTLPIDRRPVAYAGYTLVRDR